MRFWATIGFDNSDETRTVALEGENWPKVANPFSESLTDGAYLDQMVVHQQFKTCKGCPQLESCVSSPWMEKPTGSDNLADVTSVHTCGTCGDKSFDIFGGDHGKLEVPDDCPRWCPSFGSATDCGGCREARDVMKASDPGSERRAELVMEAFKSMFSSEKGDEVGRRRSIKEGSAQIAAATRPLASFEDVTLDAVLCERADRVFSELVADIIRRWPTTWNQLEPFQVDIFKARWFTRIYHALAAAKDNPQKVSWEFVLEFTDTHPWRRAWQSKSIPERRLIHRGWRVLVSQD